MQLDNQNGTNGSVTLRGRTHESPTEQPAYDINKNQKHLATTPATLSGRLYNLIHYTGTPLFMLLCIPNISMLVWYGAVKCEGSVWTMFKRFHGNGYVPSLVSVWVDAYQNVNSTVVLTLLMFCVFEVALMKAIPGKKSYGPLTPKGHVPEYKDNGFACYCCTMLAFLLTTLCLKAYGLTPSFVYDYMDGFLLVVNIMGHILCLCLLVKGFIAPSTPDNGSSGNILFDYYWGMDLYPRIFGLDVKVFTNCRFGMTIWPLLCLIFALKSYEQDGFVDSVWLSTFLQMTYITKFFVWEAGYYQSIDIIMDRAGYMICWGCMCYIPSVYASVSLYLAANPVHLGNELSILILLAGFISIAVNYWADYQRQLVRSTQGKCTIWGKSPEVIKAKYRLENGEEKCNLLLVSGFWGLSRHFNYVPEILLSFFWSLPALFSNILVYFYTIYLTTLLVHRAYRDDDKCRGKYGKYWDEYCKKVPHKMIPGLF